MSAVERGLSHHKPNGRLSDFVHTWEAVSKWRAVVVQCEKIQKHGLPAESRWLEQAASHPRAQVACSPDSGLLSQYYIPGFATIIFAIMEHFVSDFAGGFAGNDDSVFREEIFEAILFLQCSMVAAPGYLLSPHEAPGFNTASADPMVYGLSAHCRRSQMECRHIDAHIEAPLGTPDSLRNQVFRMPLPPGRGKLYAGNHRPTRQTLAALGKHLHPKARWPPVVGLYSGLKCGPSVMLENHGAEVESESMLLNSVLRRKSAVLSQPLEMILHSAILLGNNTILVRKKADRRAVLLKELDSTFPTFDQ
ncbi:hypothetical protein C8R45DRAFT_943566 [Mycena sanguinolenta]|nr:hypothetical protein C8R45DRAFT_943566 [Mycena sanguinolenta]